MSQAQKLTREEAWRRYVNAADVEVSDEAIANELAYIELDLRHRMQYDRMSGGDVHLNPSGELAAQHEELVELATFEAKEPLVLRRIIAEQGLAATPEELEAEAEDMARRERTTVDMVRRFFGDDLAGLEGDVLRRKAQEWVYAQG